MPKMTDKFLEICEFGMFGQFVQSHYVFMICPFKPNFIRSNIPHSLVSAFYVMIKFRSLFVKSPRLLVVYPSVCIHMY